MRTEIRNYKEANAFDFLHSGEQLLEWHRAILEQRSAEAHSGQFEKDYAANYTRIPKSGSRYGIRCAHNGLDIEGLTYGEISDRHYLFEPPTRLVANTLLGVGIDCEFFTRTCFNHTLLMALRDPVVQHEVESFLNCRSVWRWITSEITQRGCFASMTGLKPSGGRLIYVC